MIQIFISYHHEDGEFVACLRQQVEAAGFSVWMDTSDRAGDGWCAEIDTALRASQALVVI
jgi:hypothetical protein